MLHRAAEMDAAESLLPTPDELDPEAVEEAAVEAGLSRSAVRRAMKEVLHTEPELPEAVHGGRGLTPRNLSVSRTVPGPVDEVADVLQQFLRRQLFTRQRIFGECTRWAPRRGWAIAIRKSADPSGRFVLKQVRRVDLLVAPGDDHDTDMVFVQLDLDVSAVRSIHSSYLTGGAVSGGVIVGAAGIAVGVDPLMLAAVPAAGGAVAGGHFLGRHAANRELEAIHTEVAGVLDRLEHPDKGGGPRRGKTDQ